MDTSNFIYQKLEAFIKKFYTNELIRGIVLFLGLGLIYLLFTLFIEYFLWLKPTGRTFLFCLFLGVEFFLLLRFILFPIFKLLKLKKGIDLTQASIIIGNHFTDVQDSLTNFLQLSDANFDKNKSELLAASIEQKANNLQSIPFKNAISFASNKKYLPVVIVPLLFFAFIYITGNNEIISQSLNRVVHFNAAFLPPAPFKFVVLNDNLQTEQNKDFDFRVVTLGKVVPENVAIFIDDESYFMEKSANGEFKFKIIKPFENMVFHLEANNVSSSEYVLKIVSVPSISNFEMQLNFPSYLKLKNQISTGTGNAVIPEGTIVSWNISTLATQKIQWFNASTKFPFSKYENLFKLSKKITQNTEYQIITSNDKVKNYEKLNYKLTVIKDQFPSIKVSNAPDSLRVHKNFIVGQISDDYGISKLQIIYYPKNKIDLAKRGNIVTNGSSFNQFVFSFPSNLSVEQGISYDYYFEVFDNDALHNFKSTKSSIFNNRIATDEEKENELLQMQNENIKGLQQSLKAQDKQFSEMDKLQNAGKEKDNSDFKDKQKANDFLMRQKKQDEMMKDFAKKMKENLDDFKSDDKDEFKEDLQKRLDKANNDLEENKKLLEELNELNNKIKSEEFLQKLDKFKQNSKSQSKNLFQLVELTKRYYVEKKAEQLGDKLDKLSEKQEQLSEDKVNSFEKQEEINKDFNKIQEELKDLDKENKELKQPVDLPDDSSIKESIKEDLKDASENLKNNNSTKAKPKQKNASKKMKSMSMKMEQSLADNDKEQLEEDAQMLRQILDNLLAFSLSQEDLMLQFRNVKTSSPSFNKNIKSQQNLKLQFKHVDDSLFTMSLRNPKIAENITKEIGNVDYNIDKSLETLTDSQIPKGLSYQQYAIAAANKLGDFLSDILNSMQKSLSSMGQGKPKPGKGEGEGMQLPDIIKKQQGLGEKIKEGLKQEGKGDQGKDGKKEQGSKPGNSHEGNGQDGEGNAKNILDIYKQQKQLRESLQNELQKQGLGNNGKNILDQMKLVEKALLNKGFNNDALQRILNINQELLKLETAIQEQGVDNKRKSESNNKEFNNTSQALPPALLEYLNSIEILNRQSLPLHENFNRKVQEYFNKHD